jgi:hypothetical protein
MTDADRSIMTDEPAAEVANTEFDAVAAFENLLDGKRPSEEAGEGTETTEAPEAPAEAEEEEKSEDEPKPEKLADDDAMVSIKVGEEEHKVAVKDLKRLWGQETSLMRKAQETAEAHQRASTEGEKAVILLDAMLKRSQQKFAPYSQIDFAKAAIKLDDASYTQLRKDAQEAHAEMMFFQQEADTYLKLVRDNRAKQFEASRKTTDEALAKDPETKGWDEKARTEVLDYAVAQGLHKDIASQLADPAAFKLIRKAMLYDKGAKAIEDKVKPVAKSSSKVTLKPGARGDTAHSDKQRDALKRLSQSGSRDDAAAAFAARFFG